MFFSVLGLLFSLTSCYTTFNYILTHQDHHFQLQFRDIPLLFSLIEQQDTFSEFLFLLNNKSYSPYFNNHWFKIF